MQRVSSEVEFELKQAVTSELIVRLPVWPAERTCRSTCLLCTDPLRCCTLLSKVRPNTIALRPGLHKSARAVWIRFDFATLILSCEPWIVCRKPGCHCGFRTVHSLSPGLLHCAASLSISCLSSNGYPRLTCIGLTRLGELDFNGRLRTSPMPASIVSDRFGNHHSCEADAVADGIRYETSPSTSRQQSSVTRPQLQVLESTIAL